MEDRQLEYFIARYSLIPDIQIDMDTFLGKTKEEKFEEWLSSFECEKKKEIEFNGYNYVVYCQKISEYKFLMSFAKGTNKTIGQKTEIGIIDSKIKDYKRCNIFINTKSQFFIIEKNLDVSANIISLKNSISKVISRSLKKINIYFELELMTEKNDFWKYVQENNGEITDVEIKLASPNLLDGILTVKEFLKQTNQQYNNTSILIKLSNEEGRLTINPENEFLQDAIRYSTAGCGSWKAKVRGKDKWYSNTDSPLLVLLPSGVEQLSESDLEAIYDVYNQVKELDPEEKEG